MISDQCRTLPHTRASRLMPDANPKTSTTPTAEGMAQPGAAGQHRLVIKPKRGWQLIDFRELWRYRELAYFLCWRDIKVRYKQTALGALWAVLQPVLLMAVFTVIGRAVKVPSDNIPYPIFVFSGLLAWQYFANALNAAGNSLVNSSHLITKVYFPRLITPASAALAGLVDFAIGAAALACLMVYYRFALGWGVLLVPYLVCFTFLTALGVGLWLSALNVEYRDVRHIIPFLIQVGMFVTPVIYPVSVLPDRWQALLYMNPMAGLIENYRACVVGLTPINWSALALSNCGTVVILLSGLMYFRRMEYTFADVI